MKLVDKYILNEKSTNTTSYLNERENIKKEVLGLNIIPIEPEDIEKAISLIRN
jgi:hypothetical protein